jgi:tetratricopeptide (TPR) repeat protein
MSLDKDVGAAYSVYTLSGLSSTDEHLILELLGHDLTSRFSKEKLLAVANEVSNIPQRLLYIRWLNPSTHKALSEVARDLSHNLELPNLINHAIMRSNSPIIPFLALGRVRSVRFEEGLFASLWDRLGGGSVQGYITSRDRLLDLGILSWTGDVPGIMQINPAVHVHLEKYVTRELAPEQLAQIEYHIGEYYKGLFLNSGPGLSADALDEFVYHSARARNIEAATRFVIVGGWLEKLRRDGQALGVRRVLTTARMELKSAIEDEANRTATDRADTESHETLLDIMDLEMSHVLSDLSEYEQALAALARAATGSTASGDTLEAAQFREMIAFRRGVCLGDSGELQGAVLSYLGLIDECMLSGRLTRIAVEALGYAALVLGYLQEQAARPLGILSVDLAERLHNARLIVRNCCSFAQLLSFTGSVDEAEQYLARAEANISSSGNRPDRRELGRVLVAKASTYLAIGDLNSAKSAVDEASSLNSLLGDRRRSARAQAFAGVIAFREGHLAEARTISAEALDALVRVGDVLNALVCCFNLAYFDGIVPAQVTAVVAAPENAASSWTAVLKEFANKKYAIEAIGNFWSTSYCKSILGLSSAHVRKADPPCS